jgi:hypothetical protein
MLPTIANRTLELDISFYPAILNERNRVEELIKEPNAPKK